MKPLNGYEVAREGSLERLSEFAEPSRDGLADLGRRVFLNEVRTGDGDFGLIRPASTELTLRPRQDRSGFRIDEKLWNGARGHPFCVAIHQFDHVGGFAVDGDLPRPVQGRLAIVGCSEGRSVVFHFFLAERAENRGRQHRFNEEIAFKDEIFALG